MRKSFERQQRFGSCSIYDLQLNLNCRDEIVPILASLRHLFTQQELRNKICRLVAKDLNPQSRRDVGRPGFDDWQVIVLAVVRHGCNLDYDKLQNLAEEHQSLRHLMQIGDWDEPISFDWRRIQAALTMLKPQTIQCINQAIVAYGQDLHGEARQEVRADSFVIETNIHYPTESSLIYDGIRKVVSLCIPLASELEQMGWRQAEHLIKQIKKVVRNISRIAASKSPNAKAALPSAYENLLKRVNAILERAKTLLIAEKIEGTVSTHCKAIAIQEWIELTEQVCDTANRRVLLGETVPNQDKLFSLFETHTQIYKRGKSGQPIQYGRLALVFEDGAGFISHYCLMDRAVCDADVIVAETRKAQQAHHGKIRQASFDRGFYTAENKLELRSIVGQVSLCPRAPKQYGEQLTNETVEERSVRYRHAGIESAIGGLQRGNGLNRCRDRSEVGLERYLGLGVLSRNMQVLGKLLITREAGATIAGHSLRAAG